MIAADHVVALTTAPSEREADALARGLVEKRLAACVQISSPIRAIYRWQDRVWNEPEWQLWIKTTKPRLEAIEGYLHANHSGDVPEFIVMPTISGSSDYLNWMSEQTQQPSE